MWGRIFAVAGDKIIHGFWTGIGISVAVSSVGWLKYVVKDASAQIDWRRSIERAKERPQEIFENPKRAK